MLRLPQRADRGPLPTLQMAKLMHASKNPRPTSSICSSSHRSSTNGFSYLVVVVV
jgi:hypothetical protein